MTIRPRSPSGQALVLWLTGLPGSGKSTIAERVCRRLRSQGVAVEHLDGDSIRKVFPSTGFSRQERDDHVRRVGFMASRLEHHGITVVASLVSPYSDSRDFIRGLCQNFAEIYISTPLDECERRDPKGLYGKARRGEIRQLTGVDDPYETPHHPELTIDTTRMSIQASVNRVLALVARTGPTHAKAVTLPSLKLR